MGDTRWVRCTKDHWFTTEEERTWNGRYCPAPTPGGQCQEPLHDPLVEAPDA